MKRFFVSILLLSILSGISIAQDVDKTDFERAEDHYELGNQLYSEGQYAEALVEFQRGLDVAQDLNDPLFEWSILRDIGTTYRTLEEYESADQAYQEAMIIAQTVEDWAKVGNSLNGLGLLYAAWGNEEQAFEYYHQAVEIYETQVHDPYNFGTTLANIGWLQRQLGHYDEALGYYLQGLSVSRRAGDFHEQNTTLHKLGDLYSHFDQDEQALTHFSEALYISRKVGNHHAEAATLNDIGIICDAHDQDQIALEYYLAALHQHRLTGDRSEEATTLGNIASAFHKQKQYAEELDYLEQQLPIYRDRQLFAEQATVLSNISFAHLELEHYEQAVDYLQQAQEINEGLQDPSNEGTIISNIGRVYFREAKYEEALEYYFRALAIHQGSGPRIRAGIDLIRVGKAYELLERHDLAASYFGMALPVVQEVENQSLLRLALQGLATNYDMLGQIKLAENYRGQIGEPEIHIPKPLCQPLMAEDEIPSNAPTTIAFTVANDSDTPICSVYLDEVDSFKLGVDRLGIRQYIPAFAEHQLAVMPGAYDFALVDCSSNPMDFYRAFEISEPSTFMYQFIPDRVQPLVDQAAEYLNTGDSRQALARYRTILPIVKQSYRQLDSRQFDTIAFQALLNSGIGWLFFDLGHYDLAEENAVIALALYSTLENLSSTDLDGKMVANATLGNIYVIQGRFDDSLLHYDQARAIVFSQIDLPGIAIFNTLRSLVLRLQGNNLQALSLIVSVSQGQGLPADFAQSLLCDMYRIQGNYRDQNCEEILARQLEDNPYLQVFNYTILGATQLERGQYEEALANFEEALAISTALDNQALRAEALNAKGAAHFSLGQYELALNAFDEALAFSEPNKLVILQEQLFANKAVVSESTGEIGEAINLYNQALDLSREMGLRSDEAAILMNLGSINRFLGRYTLANEHYTDALIIATELDEQSRQASIMGNQGILFAQVRLYDQALEAYRSALAIQQDKDIKDRDGEGYVQGNIGELHRLNKNFSSAQDAFRASLTIHNEVGNQLAYAVTLNNLGRVEAELGNHDSAIDWMTQAVEKMEQINSPHWQSVLLTDRGMVHELKGDIAEAQRDYAKALELETTVIQNASLDSAILGILEQRQREELFPFNQTAAQRLTVLSAQNGDIEASLAYAEQDRAILARTELTGKAIEFYPAVEESLLRREIELRSEVQRAQTVLVDLLQNNSSASQDIGNAQTRLDDARTEYDLHLEKMQLEGGYLEREISVQTASLAAIQAAIPDDTTLLIYSIAADITTTSGLARSVVFLVTQNSLETVPLDVTDQQISDQLRNFAADRRNNVGALRNLYDLVMAPIAGEITTSRLLISPGASLNYAPFAALQAPDNSYLIDKYTISMIPSATTLVLLKGRPVPNSSAPGLVLAQPIAPGLPRLIYAPLEAMGVAETIGAMVNLDASETDLRVGVAGQKILHVSAHAELNPFAPMYSAVHLGADDQHDGRLEIREIYELDLSQGTELVILSGCETGTGGSGEDFGLMNRAFFAAGAQEVVASLWVVDDQATADLLLSFTKHRAQSGDSGNALHAAMLEIREQYPEPYLWASFVLNG